jgi:hypothetical protein
VIAVSCRLLYNVTLAVSTTFNYSLSAPVYQSITLNYADATPVAATITLPYAEGALLAKRTLLPYSLTAPIAASCNLPYSILSTNKAAKRTLLSYSITGQQPRNYIMVGGGTGTASATTSIVTTPKVTVNGTTIEVLSISLTADEHSPFWLGNIKIPNLADAAGILIYDPVTLTIAINNNGNLVSETFNLIVDSVKVDRSNISDQYATLTCISQLALLDKPYSKMLIETNGVSVDAKSAALAQLPTAMVSDFTWNLQTWTIPKMQYSDYYPLGIIKDIVKAIGGLVESNPDGSIVCRMIYPVSVPNYATATVQQSYDNTQIFSISESLGYTDWYNNVLIANDDSLSGNDYIEVINQGDPCANLVNVYPWPVLNPDGSTRTVTITHSGSDNVTMTDITISTVTISEYIEINDGIGNVTYPIKDIVGATWQTITNATLVADGYSVTADQVDYDIVQIFYTTIQHSFYVWTTTAANQLVQFVISPPESY